MMQWWIRLAVVFSLGTPMTGIVAMDMPLHGTWFRPCWEGIKGFNYEHIMKFGKDLEIDGRTFLGEIALTYIRFTVQPTCEKMDVEFRGIADVKAWNRPVSLPGDSPTFEIDTKWLSGELRALSSTAAANFKQMKLCGIENWEENVYQDVAGKDCEGIHPPEKAGSYLQIYRIAEDQEIRNPHPTFKPDTKRVIFGSDPEGQKSGNYLTGVDPKRRPSQLDPTAVYLLVPKVPQDKSDRAIEPLKKPRKKRAVIGGSP